MLAAVEAGEAVSAAARRFAVGRSTVQNWVRAFHLSHVLTDNGSCFTPAFARACAELGAEYRHTKPRTPQTNGLEAASPLLPPGDRFAMVERSNGRIGPEVLKVTICAHRGLEQLLRGFNAACNDRCQRVLEGKTPNQVVAECLKAQRKLVRGEPEGCAGPDDVVKARLLAEDAEEVSHPDS